ncbi:MAG: cytochrome C oxidase subunit IV family protein [Deltaproteobacteria bacterium]|nr:cytochrome C oxidase subunit IV family protein [Deltaproteobacteria bacterium]MCB9788304.1 cytochrome C oxidase subunit IV family protein [Deltaproteobacteria bacterium]
MATTYIRGKQVEPEMEAPHHDVAPMSLYWKVFGALLVLTCLTVAVSYADLGKASLAVAMVVAVVKSTFVVMYFMHLKGDDRTFTFIFLSTLVFVGIFFGLTFADLSTRDAVNSEWGYHGWANEKGQIIERTAPAHGEGGHEAAAGHEAAPTEGHPSPEAAPTH